MKNFVFSLTLAFLSLMAVSSAHAILFTVDASSNSSSGGSGLNTGISLSVGELFTSTVDPSDLWSAGALPRWSDADGLDGNLFATGSDESGQAAGIQIGADFGLWSQFGLSASFGSLVGELSGTYFVLGTSFSGLAPATGTLNLFYWDSNNGDNTGNIVADIQVAGAPAPVPEPSTILLLGSGLIGLIGYNYRRRKEEVVQD